MSAKKRTKSSKKPTKKDKHALSPIEKELLDCCEKRQPVLLYGKDTYRREELVKKIHSLNDGINREWEYEGNKSTKRIDGMREELRKLRTDRLLGDIRRKKLYKDKDYEGSFNKYMLDCNDTSRTYKYDDWGRKNGQAVSDDLSKFEYKRIDSGGNIGSKLLNIKNCQNRNDIVCIRRQYKKSDTQRLLEYKGTLFINNLRCKKEDTVDENGYVDLAVKIESLKKEVPNSQRGWLVFYTRDYSTFPPYFREQFKLVSLDGKKTVVDPEREEAESEDVQVEKTVAYDWSIHNKREIFCNGQLIAKLPNLQFKLFESLYKKSGKYVKNKTLDKCWSHERPNYKATLPTTMSKLNARLEKGLKKHHIMIKNRVIEPKQENKKNVSYKLVT